MRRTVVINIVGLSTSIIDKESTPFLYNWTAGKRKAYVKPAFPAVTCSAQSNYLTGKFPETHGIVGNGWYHKDECEVKFWKQSNKLVQAEKLWEKMKKLDSSFTCANMFWWYNMYSSVDYSVTPRPMYPADGRKLPDVYSHPAPLRDFLQNELGQFPLFQFWGPGASIKSSNWIAEASKIVEMQYQPTLSLVYLPHLDYCLQKFGPDRNKIQKELKEIDALCESLFNFYSKRGVKIIALSEYGISPVSKPVSLNRALREKGLISVREELGKELLDAGASEAFAVADHQIAHIYIKDAGNINKVKSIIEGVAGVELVLDKSDQHNFGIAHERSGDLLVVANKDSWFTYYYWLDDKKAPDFASCVDIHRKPGYDPAEMFIDPKIRFPKLKLGLKLLKKKLGFRYLIDVIPLDPSMVKGSHGRLPEDKHFWPLIYSENIPAEEIESIQVFDVIQNTLLEPKKQTLS